MADLRSYFQGIDLDTGAGTDLILAVALRLSGDGGSVAAEGQKTMAGSLPVTFASDQSALTVDSELPVAAALADNAANPTAPAVGAFLMLWDSATWDRASGTAVDGLLVNLGANNDVTVASGSITADTEFPAAAALADNAVNPTTPLVGACLLGFDGSTWDRIYTVADGDSVAAGTKGFLALGTDGANYQVLATDSAGHVQVDVLTGGSETLPTNPVLSYQTSASLAAGASVALNTAEAASKKLRAVHVWTSVAFKATLTTIDNAVESAVKALGGGPAFVPWLFQTPHRDYIATGTTAGADNFRVNVTNLDDANAADVYAVFYYED